MGPILTGAACRQKPSERPRAKQQTTNELHTADGSPRVLMPCIPSLFLVPYPRWNEIKYLLRWRRIGDCLGDTHSTKFWGLADLDHSPSNIFSMDG